VSTAHGNASVSAGAVRSRSGPKLGSASRWRRGLRRPARAARLAGQQRRLVGGAPGRSRRGPGGRFPSGVRQLADTGPGSRPEPRRPAAVPSKWLNEWYPFPPWPASRPGGLDNTTGWTSCTISPLRSTAARSTTGTWSPSPQPSTTSSAPSYDDAVIPHVRCSGRGGDTGVTSGGSQLEHIFSLSPRAGCHQSLRFGAFWR
jgi:hypothetical protein